jgi:acyl-CoA hydrolase
MEKTRASTKVSTRKIISGEHLNPNGTLFGGYLMSWMDEVSFLCARRFTGLPTCVTVNIDNVTFRNPLLMGEHILLTATINLVGRSSMEIEVAVEREDPVNCSLTHTNSAHLTFVCLDKDFKAVRVPGLILETDDDRRKNSEARLRRRVRRRLVGFLSKRRYIADEVDEVPTITHKFRQIMNRALDYVERAASQSGAKFSDSTSIS